MLGLMQDLAVLLDEYKDIVGVENLPTTTYEVEIVEVRKRKVRVEMPCGSYYEAKNKVYADYLAGEVVLDDTTVSEVEINVDILDEEE